MRQISQLRKVSQIRQVRRVSQIRQVRQVSQIRYDTGLTSETFCLQVPWLTISAVVADWGSTNARTSNLAYIRFAEIQQRIRIRKNIGRSIGTPTASWIAQLLTSFVYSVRGGDIMKMTISSLIRYPNLT